LEDALCAAVRRLWPDTPSLADNPLVRIVRIDVLRDGVELILPVAMLWRLTEAGRRFVAEVDQAMSILDRAVKTAGMHARGEQGVLLVGVYALVAGEFLDTLLERFRAPRASRPRDCGRLGAGRTDADAGRPARRRLHGLHPRNPRPQFPRGRKKSCSFRTEQNTEAVVCTNSSREMSAVAAGGTGRGDRLCSAIEQRLHRRTKVLDYERHLFTDIVRPTLTSPPSATGKPKASSAGGAP
jgi:hypothetical protein